MAGALLCVGDVHGSLELKKLSRRNFPLGATLDHGDILVIMGDAGFMWDDSRETKYWDDWTNDLGFTVCAIRGNHENYDVIDSLPAEEWNGGTIRRVREHVMYLDNGNVFNLNGRSCFVMGGATSVDRAYRVEGKSWWATEIPSREQMEQGVTALESVNYKVDYIFTHCAPNYLVDILFPYEKEFAHDTLTNYLEKVVRQRTQFSRWVLGHYHVDRSYDNQKYNILYNDIVELTADGDLKVWNN